MGRYIQHAAGDADTSLSPAPNQSMLSSSGGRTTPEFKHLSATSISSEKLMTFVAYP